MYRPNFSKDVLMSYILDIENELFSSENIHRQLVKALEIIKNLKVYIREG